MKIQYNYLFVFIFGFILFANSQSWNSAPYCTPSTGTFAIPCSQGGPSNAPGNWINDFINGLYTTGAVVNINNQNSGCNGLPNNYIFYCNHPLQVNAGQTLTMSVQSASVYAGGFAVFVDWNQDNVFQLPSERVAFTNNIPPAYTWANMTITIPASQAPGVYRMRVREVYATSGGLIDPCNFHAYGETEDYSVYVGTAPPSSSAITATASPNQTVCIGQNANLSVSYSGTNSANFYWTGPNSFTSSIQNPTVVNTTTASNGFYHVSIGTQTCPVMAITHVRIDDGPVTLGASVSNTSICNGSTVSLTANGSNNYTWTPGNSTNTTIIVSPSVTTVYTVASTSTTGCTGTRTRTVVVNPSHTLNLTASPSVICVGGTSTITVTGASNYTWSNSSTSTVISVSPTLTTIYTVTGTGSLCAASNSISLVVNNCTALNEFGFSDRVVYPNPFNNVLKFKDSEGSNIEFYNAEGKMIFQMKIPDTGEVETHHLPLGIYLLRLHTERGIKVIRVFKQ